MYKYYTYIEIIYNKLIHFGIFPYFFEENDANWKPFE